MSTGGARAGAGRPKHRMDDERVVLALKARKYADEAIATLLANMKDPNGAVRNTAATEMLNRGFGKAPQEIILEDGQNDAVADRPKGLSELLGMAREFIAEGTEDDPEAPSPD